MASGRFGIYSAGAPAAHDLAVGARFSDMTEGVGASIPETLGVRRGADAEGIEDCNDRSHILALFQESPVLSMRTGGC